VERTLDLAASYRFSMPHSVPVPQAEPVVEPAGSEAPPAVEEPEPEEDDLGFPEVEPAEPAPPWTPEARDDTGDDDRGQPRPSTEP
jgi:hypothetical protein